jgi:DegV family protein with EDD domain
MKLTAANTAVVLDSTADFPEAPTLFPNFRVVPLYVRFGDESFRDYEEMTPDQFYERLARAPELPTTSQPTPGDFLSVYEELSSYERILSIQISSTLSGTFASAQTAAATVGERVRVIDSRTVSASLALLALGVQRRLERGTTDDEIDAFVERYRQEHKLLFTVNTLEYLAKGGRIGRAAALAGNLLNVKPILAIRDGEVVPIKKVRGNQKAFAEFREMFVSSTTDSPKLKVGIAHAAAPERLAALRELVEHERPRAQIEIATTLGAVVGTHAGPGTVGFFWFEDD